MLMGFFSGALCNFLFMDLRNDESRKKKNNLYKVFFFCLFTDYDLVELSAGSCSVSVSGDRCTLTGSEGNVL